VTDDAPEHPGKILFEQVMTPLGVSRNKLARDIDVPVGCISDIVAGKRGVTPDTALRFARYFGTTPELWLRLQADYDLHVVRTTTWPKAEAKVAILEPAPAPEGAPPTEAPAPAGDAIGEGAAAETETADVPAPANTSEGDVPPATDDGMAEDIDVGDDEDIDIPEPLPGAGRS
jgi:addiction module HigA family antidote